MKVVIVDYQLSNIFSLVNALNYLQIRNKVSSNKIDIESADAVILPGVGSFPEAMRQLESLDLINALKNFIKSGKPFIGICLGFQLLFSKSHEFKITKGLNIFDGEVKKFDEKNNKVPHIGWNNLELNNNLNKYQFKKKLNFENSYYFVHSYYVKPNDNKIILTFTDYEKTKFCSSILKENIFACQFHPEKSGLNGIKLIKSFLKYDK